MQRKCGIYKIENVLTNKVYIGQSRCINLRLSNHKYWLSHNVHTNKHLQNSWNKYGEKSFLFETVCLCDEKDLNEKEKHYIKLYDTFENGFNGTQGGTDPEEAKEYGRRYARYVHEKLKNEKGHCRICGGETINGFNRYCNNHKHKCKACGQRFKKLIVTRLCKDCHKKLMREKEFINCSLCGKKIKRTNNRQKYCKDCAEKNKKRIGREYSRKVYYENKINRTKNVLN